MFFRRTLNFAAIGLPCQPPAQRAASMVLKSMVGQRVLKMTILKKQKRGKPKRRYMGALVEDMKVAGVKEKDTG